MNPPWHSSVELLAADRRGPAGGSRAAWSGAIRARGGEALQHGAAAELAGPQRGAEGEQVVHGREQAGVAADAVQGVRGVAVVDDAAQLAVPPAGERAGA